MPDIVVKKSGVSGLGVFAAKSFKRGEMVLKWNLSKELSSEEAEELPEVLKHFLTYFESRIFLLQEPERFVNHSCEANTIAKDFGDVASRDIKKGEKTKMSDDKFGREMHKVNCSECGKETEVPFKPDGDRPVYCRDCYQKHKKPSFNRGGRDRY